MAEWVYAADLKSAGHIDRAGSSPASSTNGETFQTILSYNMEEFTTGLITPLVSYLTVRKDDVTYNIKKVGRSYYSPFIFKNIFISNDIYKPS